MGGGGGPGPPERGVSQQKVCQSFGIGFARANGVPQKKQKNLTEGLDRADEYGTLEASQPTLPTEFRPCELNATKIWKASSYGSADAASNQ